MSSEIENLSNSLRETNFTEIILSGQSEIDNIPVMIDNFANETISGIIGPGGTFDQIREQIKGILDDVSTKVDLNQSFELSNVRNTIQGM